MDFRETILLVALAATNLGGGFVFAIFLAIGFGRLMGKKNRFFRYFVMMLGLYFLECVAFTWGMCTQVFTIAISFIWAIVFGLWLKGLAPPRQIIRQILFVSLYGCLPTVSFAVILSIVWVISGNGLLNVEQATQFGIPDFVPWPINTMLGFCVALATGTIILKTAFATGVTSLIVRKD
jgi:hypothetical protein